MRRAAKSADALTWAFECGTWQVSKAEYERLWKSADWDTRSLNDPERAWKEWRKLYG